MKRLHVFAMLIMACFWAFSGVVQAQDAAVGTGAIGNLVFYDSDHDGVQGTTETAGIEGVTVSLYQDSNPTVAFKETATDASGHYKFEGLPDGNYTVKFAKQGYSYSQPGEDPQTDTYATASVTISGGAQDLSVNRGFHRTWYTHCSIGNLVWNDLNKNGVQDLGEPGLQFVKVTLYRFDFDNDKSVLSTNHFEDCFEEVAHTETDPNGNYTFGGLCPGIYYVKIEVKDGWAVSPIFQGTSDEKDSDILPYLDRSVWICMPEGKEGLSVDAGLFKIQDCDLLTLGDMVFNDCNHNGVQDCDEKGIAGVCIKLYSCDVFKCGDGDDFASFSRRHCRGYKVDEVVTDLNGHYSFTDVLPGNYCIEVCLPHGYKIVPSGGFPDPCTPETDPTMCNPYNACTNNLGLDFGICHEDKDCALPALGDLVWNDKNDDGIQNMNESGMSGVKVTLYTCCHCGREHVGPVGFTSVDGECHSMEIGSVTTDAKGLYHFTNLIPGTYYIVVSAPLGYEASPKDVMTEGVDEDCNDSDIDEDFESYWVKLCDNEVNNCIDAGLHFNSKLVASIGDFVWRDDDGDGIQDPREIGVPGVTLKLYECKCTCEHSDYRDEHEGYECDHHSCADGDLIATTKTNADGEYEFNNIAPGKKYCVQIVVPPCFTLSPYHKGHDCDENSDFWPRTASTRCFYLEADGKNADHFDFIDAGLIPNVKAPGVVGDFVWNDANENGVQDCGEAGIPNVTVELHPCDGTGDCEGNTAIVTTKTDANGKYLFTDVTTEKTYFVKFILPGGYEFTAQDKGNSDDFDSDPCTNKGMTANFTVYSGQSTLLLDAGMVQVACDFNTSVWADDNKNGVKDDGDKVFENVTVELYNCASNSLVQSATTDAHGSLTFTTVPFGSYYYVVTLPDGYTLAQSVKDGEGSNAELSIAGKSLCFDVTKGAASNGAPIELVETTVGVAERTGIPTQFNLSQNFPNPFNPSTSINFDIPVAGQYTLKVYNMLGQEVATLINGELGAGYKTVVFDASRLSSGVYIYRLTGNNVVMTKKMMLNK